MSIKEEYFEGADTAISFLEKLALDTNNTIVFRGHSNQEHRLVNTWQRHRSIPHENWNTEIDEILTGFKVGLEKLNIESFDNENRFESLEFARHHGVPTPSLDFSYSPYVALFFAFNGVRLNYENKKDDYSVIYALNINQLASDWAKEKKLGSNELNFDNDKFYEFQHPKKLFFKNGFPANTLQFIPYPGKNNIRMQKQLGTLLYDTMNYKDLKMKDLEEYIENIQESKVSEDDKTKNDEPTLYKIFINHKCISNIFQRLELMNMTAGNLYGDADGVALDVKNAYNYNPKFSYLRDIDLPKHDDTKI